MACVICFIGDQGTGKSILCSFWGEKCFGGCTYAYTQNIDELTQQFNAAVSEKLFIYLRYRNLGRVTRIARFTGKGMVKLRASIYTSVHATKINFG